MKKLAILFLSILIIAGCSGKSAQQHGHGISIEMAHSLNIKHMELVKYVNGNEVFRGGVINANGSSFGKGEIVWFDVALSNTNSTVEIAISYSENPNGANAKTTEKINISTATSWVNVKFTKDYQLELIDMD